MPPGNEWLKLPEGCRIDSRPINYKMRAEHVEDMTRLVGDFDAVCDCGWNSGARMTRDEAGFRLMLHRAGLSTIQHPMHPVAAPLNLDLGAARERVLMLEVELARITKHRETLFKQVDYLSDYNDQLNEKVRLFRSLLREMIDQWYVEDRDNVPDLYTRAAVAVNEEDPNVM
jgi:hypothetical protein